MKHNINILLTVTNKQHVVPSTLIFDTLRVGFPTSNVKVYNNFCDDDVTMEIRRRCKENECEYESLPKRWHHGRWIEHLVQKSDDSFTILDGDIVFFNDCEDFEYQRHITGYYIPVIWNEWAKCVSYERLHTAFLMFCEPRRIRTAMGMFYPTNSNYNPLNFFMPCVGVSRGQRMFWDTCSMLFNAIQSNPFTMDQRVRYAHVNSASFHDEMLERVENKEAFRTMHEKAMARDFDWFREWYKAEDRYYMEMHQKGMLEIRKHQQEERDDVIAG